MRNRSQDEWNRGGNREGYRPNYDQDRWTNRRDDEGSGRDRDEQRRRADEGSFDDRSPGSFDREPWATSGDDNRFDDWRSRSRQGNGRRDDPDSRFDGQDQGGYGDYGYRQAGRGQGDLGRRAGSAGPYGQMGGYSSSRAWPETTPANQRSGRGFAGKGPKGYTRSDDRIRDDISDALMADDDVDASEIEVTVQNGEVTLSGTVDSRQAKRAAEDIAERCQSVGNVQNSLRVASTGSNEARSGGRAGNHNRAQNARDADGDTADRANAGRANTSKQR